MEPKNHFLHLNRKQTSVLKTSGLFIDKIIHGINKPIVTLKFPNPNFPLITTVTFNPSDLEVRAPAGKSYHEIVNKTNNEIVVEQAYGTLVEVEHYKDLLIKYNVTEINSIEGYTAGDGTVIRDYYVKITNPQANPSDLVVTGCGYIIDTDFRQLANNGDWVLFVFKSTQNSWYNAGKNATAMQRCNDLKNFVIDSGATEYTPIGYHMNILWKNTAARTQYGIYHALWNSKKVEIVELISNHKLGDFNISTDVTSNNGIGVNSVRTHASLINGFHASQMFVSIVKGDDTGAVLVYKNNTPTSTNNPTLLDVITPPNAIAGMAVNPANGDLALATYSFTTSGNIRIYSANANGKYVNFINLPVPGGDVSVWGNIAYDQDGNLIASDVTDEAIIVYSKASNYSDFWSIVCDANKIKCINKSGAPEADVYPFSAPEGVAFDVMGNLWVANNCDGSYVGAYGALRTAGQCANGNNNGTLTKINAAFIKNLLAKPKSGSAVNNNPVNLYTLTQNDAICFKIDNSQFGDLMFFNQDLLVNDESNGKVWKYNTAYDFNNNSVEAITAFTTENPGNGGLCFWWQ
ncbi:MAG: hypothetical protein ABI315_12705 [Bacteroidia bacterium]